jgi:phage protein D
MNLPQVTYTLQYNGKDISADISQSVISIEYTDKLRAEADELAVNLEDSAKLWQSPWYPGKGDTLQLYIRLNGQQLNAGTFTIDEIEGNFSTAGDTISMRAIGATFGKALRTKTTYAHANKSLQDIANTVAASLGLTVQGNIANITPSRVHQYRETALNFLNRIAGQYGYFFSVRGSILSFQRYSDIEGRPPSVSLAKSDLTGCRIKDNTLQTYAGTRIKYHFPKTKSVIQYSTTVDGDAGDSVDGSADTLEIRQRCENQQQAQAMASYALHQNNGRMVMGEIETQGNLLLISGNTVQISGIGNFSGTYMIEAAHHTINRDGAYKTSANIYRVKK